MSESFSVDPEAVSLYANSYKEEEQKYHSLSDRLENLRGQFVTAFGNDQAGTQVTTQFLTSYDGMSTQVRTAWESLDYYHHGLKTNAKLFQSADDNAESRAQDLHKVLTTDAASNDHTESTAEQTSTPAKEGLASRPLLNAFPALPVKPATFDEGRPAHKIEADTD